MRSNDFNIKYLREIFSKPSFYFYEIDFMPGFPFNRRNLFINDPAGDNIIEISKCTIDVECPAMHCHPSAAFHAHSAYLPGF